MSILVSDVVNDAYLFAGIGDQYNPLDFPSQNLAVRMLNDLSSSFSADTLAVYNVTDIQLPLVSGQQTYTIGNGQSITTYPPKIDAVGIMDAQGIKHPCRVIGFYEWNWISFLAAPGRPEYMWPNMNADTWTLNFWPVETFANDVAHIYSNTLLPQFTALSNVFTAPAGYSLYFKTQLGKLLAAINKRDLSQDQKDIADNAARAIRANNNRLRPMKSDIPQDRTSGSGWFNIFTGYPN